MRLDNKDCFIRNPCGWLGQAGVFVAGLAASAFVALGACSGGGFVESGETADGRNDARKQRSSSASMAAPPEGFPELTAVPACRKATGRRGGKGGKRGGKRDRQRVRVSSSAGPLTFLRVYSKKKNWKDGDTVLAQGGAYRKSGRAGRSGGWKLLKSSKGCSDYESVSFGCPGRALSATRLRFAPEEADSGRDRDRLYWDCTVSAVPPPSQKPLDSNEKRVRDIGRQHPLRKGQVTIQDQGKGFQISLEFASCKMEAEYSCQN